MSVGRYSPLLPTPKEFGTEAPTGPRTYFTRPTSEMESSSIPQTDYEDIHSRDFIIGEPGLNLALYSSELGQLPVHATPDFGYNFEAGNNDLAAFNGGSRGGATTMSPTMYMYGDPSQGTSAR